MSLSQMYGLQLRTRIRNNCKDPRTDPIDCSRKLEDVNGRGSKSVILDRF